MSLPVRLTAEFPWQMDSACRGTNPSLFFDEHPDSEAMAKAVCAGCPVRRTCLEHARSAGEEFGVWGGLTAPERDRLDRWSQRRGPKPKVTDEALRELFTVADPDRRALDVLAERVELGQATAYKALRRAQFLGLVERRGRYLHPARR